jgi:hypothetical protein
MKRIALVAALLGAFIFAFAGVATAGTGANYGNSGTPNVNSNGTAITHYTAPYSDSFFGPVTCTGVHQVKKSQPTQDSFTCTSESGGCLTNVTPDQILTLRTIGGWLSDAPACGQYASSFNGTVSGDGTSYSAVAT